MSAITLISPGLQTSIQDNGRPGLAHLGIPQSGAADRLSLALANYCLGNPMNAAALEITLLGPHIKFHGNHHFALCGAEITATLNSTPIELGRAYPAKAGDILKLGTIAHGARTYLALAGGIKTDPFMGSQSTYMRARLGGHKGQQLQTGDTLNTGKPIASFKTLPRHIMPRYGKTMIMHMMAGPELGNLDDQTQEQVFQTRFMASRDTDRMGARLTADIKLNATDLASMSSSPVRPGTLQCPPDGQPILLGVDGQTIGGYARIGQLIRADLPLMGQIAPGTQIFFKRINARQARQILRQRTAFYQSVMPSFSF